MRYLIYLTEWGVGRAQVAGAVAAVARRAGHGVDREVVLGLRGDAARVHLQHYPRHLRREQHPAQPTPLHAVPKEPTTDCYYLIKSILTL